MNIGQASNHSGLSPKTIRYYESVGIVVPKRQSDNHYRVYSAVDVRHLRFLHQARQAGFSLSESRELLELYRDTGRCDPDSRALLMGRIEWLDAQRQSLTDMRDLLLGIARRDNDAEPSEQTAPESATQVQTHGMSFTLVESKP